MVAISSSTVTVLPPLPGGSANAPAASVSTNPPSAAPIDTVTLSDTAQQILDGTAAPPAANAPDPTKPQTPSKDQVAAAVAALNDTSGQTALGDQIAAYEMVGTLVATGQVVTARTLLNVNPSPAATNVGTITTDQAQALVASAFAQRAEQVVAKIDGAKANGADPTKAVEAGLAAFNGLSADDQQVYLAATNLTNRLVAGQPAYASADDYRAAQQALVDSGKAPPQPAAPAPPAGYTPPTLGALMDALAKVDDTSGAVPTAQQTAAAKLLAAYQAAGPQGPAAALVAQNAATSPFVVRTAHDQTFVENDVARGDDVYQQMLDHLNMLQPDDQQAYFGAVSTAKDGSTLYASLGSLKDNLSTRDELRKIYAVVVKAYGVGSLSDLAGAAARNSALQKLQSLMSMDQGSDAWTKQAQDFINGTSPSDLGLVPADHSDPNLAKALKTLKEVADVQHKFVAAIKAGKTGQWNAVNETKAVKDKANADALMGQALDTTA